MPYSRSTLLPPGALSSETSLFPLDHTTSSGSKSFLWEHNASSRSIFILRNHTSSSRNTVHPPGVHSILCKHNLSMSIIPPLEQHFFLRDHTPFSRSNSFLLENKTFTTVASTSHYCRLSFYLLWHLMQAPVNPQMPGHFKIDSSYSAHRWISPLTEPLSKTCCTVALMGDKHDYTLSIEDNGTWKFCRKSGDIPSSFFGTASTCNVK